MQQYTYDAVVIGSGAAGYNAACRLQQFGKTAAIVTEAVNSGTSRNTGSDKQTYYKLGLGGSAPDSVRLMAADLFAGGSVDGDTALCEAALSARCFAQLCELGVPFPCNRYGEYIGYKTDHDPYARATSAGPLTSRYMTEALQAHADALGVTVHSGWLAIEILKQSEQVCGVLCLNTESGELAAFRCAAVIVATGGPAAIYADSVYPVGHYGSTSLALRAGAQAQNLAEWQYGLSSVSPRWNVSGTYMQVLPRFISVDEQGVEREFLAEYFGDVYAALSAVFLKGYQWPFDCRKVDASSVIDLLVYRERCINNRRVFLDFSKNPFGLSEIHFSRLSAEAYTYLQQAEACFGTPLERLKQMNAPAIELYRSKGVELSNDYLEIALCAQHHNGGIAVDAGWQTAVHGLFAVGECAGTHGAARPGGAALNAGQVGSLRAAQTIAAQNGALIEETAFATVLEEAVQRHRTRIPTAGDSTAELSRMQRQMSEHAAVLRRPEAMRRMFKEVTACLARISGAAVADYRLRDCLITQAAVLTAMIDHAETVGVSRGSALYYRADGEVCAAAPGEFRFLPDDGRVAAQVQTVTLQNGEFSAAWRAVRPLPAEDDCFETVWREYRDNPVK